jgi:hypothetical protein
MKKTVLIICLLCFPFCMKAQLDSITAINGIVCSSVGQSFNISIDPVPGATYYCWSNIDTLVSNFLFDGQTGPYCTSSYSIMLTLALQDSFNIVCVTAYNANDTSNTFCDTVYSFATQLQLSSTNDSIVIPNSTGIYSVLPFNGYGCEYNYFTWTITGDAYFDNSNDTLGTGSDTVNINFGPGFLTGYLCVVGQTPFNLQSPPICMTINTATGFNQISDDLFNIIYDPVNQQVQITMYDPPVKETQIEIYDMTGKIIHSEPLVRKERNIATSLFSKGMYLIVIQGDGSRFTKNFIIY